MVSDPFHPALLKSLTYRRWLISLAFALLPVQAKAQNPPPLLLANILSDDVDVSRYLVSEKYDGVRALWDGKTLHFRSGGAIPAPGWFTKKLPAFTLDGELWLGRGQFDALSGILRTSEPRDEEWRRVLYLIFELPDAPGTFAERAAKIQSIVHEAHNPQLRAVEQFRVVDRAALQRKLDEVVKYGGEGLMLHRAAAPYTTGRSDELLKLKPLLDAEATVVGHVGGKGKYEGMLGSLEVETPDGKRFRIGTGFTDAVRKNPPPVGSVITYNYRGFTHKGTPRFASFKRIREAF